jgi:hypothetical protein
MAAECKFKVARGKAGRFVRECGAPATDAIIFTSEIDTDYTVTVQLPLCNEHFLDKQNHLNAIGQPHTRKPLNP